MLFTQSRLLFSFFLLPYWSLFYWGCCFTYSSWFRLCPMSLFILDNSFCCPEFSFNPFYVCWQYLKALLRSMLGAGMLRSFLLLLPSLLKWGLFTVVLASRLLPIPMESFKLPDFRVVTSTDVGTAGLKANEFTCNFELFLPLACFEEVESSFVRLCSSIFDPYPTY